MRGRTVSPHELRVVNAKSDTLLKDLNLFDHFLETVPPELLVGFFITSDIASFI